MCDVSCFSSADAFDCSVQHGVIVQPQVVSKQDDHDPARFCSDSGDGAGIVLGARTARGHPHGSLVGPNDGAGDVASVNDSLQGIKSLFR